MRKSQVGLIGGQRLLPQAAAIIAQMTTVPDQRRRTNINTFVAALLVAGVWSKFDIFYVFAAHTSQAAHLNWVSPSTDVAVPTNSPTFTTDSGYRGNSTNQYIDSNKAFNTMSQYTLNSAHIGMYATVAPTGFGDIGGEGAFGASGFNPYIGWNAVTSTWESEINCNAAITIASTNSGHIVGNRSASNAVQIHRNGSTITSGATASTAVSTQAFTPLRMNTIFSDARIGVCHVGSSLTATEALAISNAITAYMAGL